MANFKVALDKESIDFALMGVFPVIGWKDSINGFLEKNPGKVYWLPWGNRQSQLKGALQYLQKMGAWNAIERTIVQSTKTVDYKLWQPVSKEYKPLWFFHHESKKQGGNGKIYTQYAVQYIVMAPEPISPSGHLSHTLLKQTSETWLGISAYRSAFRAKQPLDFSADFDLVDLKTGSKRQMHETKDSDLLYWNMVIVQHFSHKEDRGCNCPHCRKP